jgi:glutathione S-transferase
MTTQTQDKPTLWQIDISHYNEKARWALEYKGIDHSRRSILPGSHIPIALALTRGAQPTLPVLQLDGRSIGDSSEIIAALEAAYPEPPLYPIDAGERARAIELEDWFDENLGPHTRLLPFHELIQEPEIFAEVASESVRGPLAKARPVIGVYARAYTTIRWNANSDEGAVRAREAIAVAFDKLESELAKGDGEFLVGEHFSVADLTAASLFYPVVIPPEGPLNPELPRPPALDRFRQSLSDRRGFKWVEDTFRRHRRRN